MSPSPSYKSCRETRREFQSKDKKMHLQIRARWMLTWPPVSCWMKSKLHFDAIRGHDMRVRACVSVRVCVCVCIEGRGDIFELFKGELQDTAKWRKRVFLFYPQDNFPIQRMPVWQRTHTQHTHTIMYDSCVTSFAFQKGQ